MIYDDYCRNKELTYYLISLFYKSGCRYYCSLPKINRLLTIYKLCSINFDPNCFLHSFSSDASFWQMTSDLLLPNDFYFQINDDADNKEYYTSEFNDVIPIIHYIHVILLIMF